MDDDTRRKIGQLTGERAALQAQIDGINERIRALVEESGRRMERQLGLPSIAGPRTVNGMFTPAARLAFSAGRANKRNPLIAKANDSGFTIRSLAAAVDMSPTGITLARKGEKTIRRSAAEKIAELTGFAATKKNWPRGFSDG